MLLSPLRRHAKTSPADEDQNDSSYDAISGALGIGRHHRDDGHPAIEPRSRCVENEPDILDGLEIEAWRRYSDLYFTLSEVGSLHSCIFCSLPVSEFIGGGWGPFSGSSMARFCSFASSLYSHSSIPEWRRNTTAPQMSASLSRLAFWR